MSEPNDSLCLSNFLLLLLLSTFLARQWLTNIPVPQSLKNRTTYSKNNNNNTSLYYQLQEVATYT